jgi:hypothetical protein
MMIRRILGLTMLFHCPIHYTLFAGSLFDCGEEIHFLVAMMLFYAPMPCKTVVPEVPVIGRRNSRGLLIDSIEPADKAVVREGHV